MPQRSIFSAIANKIGGAPANCPKSGNLGRFATALHALARANRRKSVCFVLSEIAQTL
jgi:hypothetical protein